MDVHLTFEFFSNIFGTFTLQDCFVEEDQHQPLSSNAKQEIIIIDVQVPDRLSSTHAVHESHGAILDPLHLTLIGCRQSEMENGTMI